MAQHNRRVVQSKSKTSQPSQLQLFCTRCVPDFAPLGGGRPDTAVVACVAVSLYVEGLPADVIMAPDVLDTALAVLCAPLVVTDATDLEALFRQCPAVSVRLRTMDEELLGNLKTISESSGRRLAVTMELDDSVTVLPYQFMWEWGSVTRVDLRRTSIQRTEGFCFNGCPKLTCIELPKSLTSIGPFDGSLDAGFASGCEQLTKIVLPDSVTEIGDEFLYDTYSLWTTIDLKKNTALRRIGRMFGAFCQLLTSVVLPDTLTEVGSQFLAGCASLRTIDLTNTALRTVGYLFASQCPLLTKVALPDTLIEVADAIQRK